MSWPIPLWGVCLVCECANVFAVCQFVHTATAKYREDPPLHQTRQLLLHPTESDLAVGGRHAPPNDSRLVDSRRLTRLDSERHCLWALLAHFDRFLTLCENFHPRRQLAAHRTTTRRAPTPPIRSDKRRDNNWTLECWAVAPPGQRRQLVKSGAQESDAARALLWGLTGL